MADDIDWTEAARRRGAGAARRRARRRAADAGAGGGGRQPRKATRRRWWRPTGDTISIAPADPDVVYVPSYDPAVAYTTPVAQPVVVTGHHRHGPADHGRDRLRQRAAGRRDLRRRRRLGRLLGRTTPIDWDDDDFYPRGGHRHRRREHRPRRHQHRSRQHQRRPRPGTRSADNDGERIVDRGPGLARGPRAAAGRARPGRGPRDGPARAATREAAEARLKARGADSGGQAQLAGGGGAARGRGQAAGGASRPCRPTGGRHEPRVDRAAHRGARSIEKSGAAGARPRRVRRRAPTGEVRAPAEAVAGAAAQGAAAQLGLPQVVGRRQGACRVPARARAAGGGGRGGGGGGGGGGGDEEEESR